MSLVFRAFGGAAINGTEPLREGIFKLVFQGGGYWFLYVLFLIFAIYPWIEKACSKQWMVIVLGIVLLILGELLTFPSLFMLESVIYYLPYFILGYCLREKIQDMFTKRGTRIVTAILMLLGFIVLDFLDKKNFVEMNITLKFLRAIAIMSFLYILVLEFKILRDKKGYFRNIHKILIDCSKYSLQLYLFNGYILTILRIIICQILQIKSPLIIVLTIWSGNLVITLIACKWIIPYIPVLREVCGLERN